MFSKVGAGMILGNRSHSEGSGGMEGNLSVHLKKIDFSRGKRTKTFFRKEEILESSVLEGSFQVCSNKF